jgi:hypothetical protein
MLEQLEEGITVPGDQVRFYLLRARASLAVDDRPGCENAIREIFSLNLSSRIQIDSLEDELRFYFNKVRAEYWFSLDKVQDEEEKIEQRVIEQTRQKPRKKSVLPKLLLGTVLLAVAAGAVWLIALGGKGSDENGEMGTLKFQNLSYGGVSIEVGGIEKYVQGTSYYHYGMPEVNKVLIDLMPGNYDLHVTYDGEVYTYPISISKGSTTLFVFDPHTLK